MNLRRDKFKSFEFLMKIKRAKRATFKSFEFLIKIKRAKFKIIEFFIIRKVRQIQKDIQNSSNYSASMSKYLNFFEKFHTKPILVYFGEKKENNELKKP